MKRYDDNRLEPSEAEQAKASAKMRDVAYPVVAVGLMFFLVLLGMAAIEWAKDDCAETGEP